MTGDKLRALAAAAAVNMATVPTEDVLRVRFESDAAWEWLSDHSMEMAVLLADTIDHVEAVGRYLTSIRDPSWADVEAENLLARFAELLAENGEPNVKAPEQALLNAARKVVEEYDDPVEGTEGASETEFHDRIELLREALARLDGEKDIT